MGVIQLKKEHVDVVMELFKTFDKDTLNLTQTEEYLSHPEHLLFVYRTDEEVIGYVLAKQNKENNNICIRNIEVLKGFRTKGIATTLVKTLISTLRDTENTVLNIEYQKNSNRILFQ